ncbi:PEP-CTERM sorting domain-containing protein [bacterium]|nr:PEP-CTERM sorting domain-containing protein [bacterium]
MGPCSSIFLPGVDPTNASSWSDAGVVGDLSDAAGGTISGFAGSFFNIDNLTSTIVGGDGAFGGSAFANPLLSDYTFTFGTQTITIGGFETGGVANTLTSSLGDMDGNTFTLTANQQYTLYLFGTGDQDDQNSLFTFNGQSASTSPTIVGTDDDAGHFVTFDFTTGADLTGFELEFTVDPEGTGNGAFNGLALVASPVPEPSTPLLVFGAAFAGLAQRRRKS